jgi:para-nitrobenzyl esterase
MTNMTRRLKPLHPFAVPFALAALAALLPVNAGTAWAQDSAFVVSTKSGQLRGVARPGGGAEFLGIPYAQAPVGDLRWHEPLPAKPWSGVRNAAAFGAPCAQPDLGEWNRRDAEAGREDCLFLNVITPVWPVKKPLPVMFWIHGGGNRGGTASSALYKDGTLVDHGVLLVTVNYRLGIFGFFAHPELTSESPRHASGNYGLMDQILALRWVIENIAKFGGDPKNITVFGQSAGAQDTSLLMTSLARNLFQKAIAESGTSFGWPLPPLAEAEQTGEKLAASLKAPAGNGALQYLRQIPAPGLVAAMTSMDSQSHSLFGPDIDGWVIARSPAEVFASGQESAIPLLFGTTTREYWTPASADELRKKIADAAGRFAPQTLAAYGLASGGEGTADPLYGPVASQWDVDELFRCPATTQAAWHSAAHHPAYEYEFERATPSQEAQGAVHSADLPYVFGYYPKSGQFGFAADFVEIDFKLADRMETYWTNFAKTGNPNSDGLPYWPEFGKDQALIEFTQGGQVVTAARLRGVQCDLYRKVLAERMKQGR